MKRFNFYLPSFGGSWLLVAVLMFGLVLSGLLFGIYWPKAPQSVTYGYGMLIPAAFAFLVGGRSRKMGGESVPVDNTDIGSIKLPVYGILLLAALVSTTVIIDPLTALIPMPERFKALFEAAFYNAETYDLILSTCILAPLFEELLCRGCILRGMLANGKSPRKAIFWSAFIFAFIHLNPWQSIPAFVIGILFGWVYYRTRSLWTTIALHAVNNGTSVVLSKLYPGMDMDTSLFDIIPTAFHIPVFLAALALLFIAVRVLDKKLPKQCTKNSIL